VIPDTRVICDPLGEVHQIVESAVVGLHQQDKSEREALKFAQMVARKRILGLACEN